GLVGEMLGKQWPHGAVDEPRAQHFLLGRAPLPLEEATRDLPGGVGALPIIHGERHEIAIRAGGLGGARRDRDHRPPELPERRTARELGHLARTDRERLVTQLDRCLLFHRDLPFLCLSGPALAGPSPSPPDERWVRAARSGSPPPRPESRRPFADPARSGGPVARPPSTIVRAAGSRARHCDARALPCRGPRAGRSGPASAPQAPVLQPFPIAIDLRGLEIVQQTTTLPHHAQQTATRRVIALVNLEVLGQVVDLLGEKRDLDLGRPRVPFVLLELADDSL